MAAQRGHPEPWIAAVPGLPQEFTPPQLREQLRRRIYVAALWLGLVVLALLWLVGSTRPQSTGLQASVNALLIGTCVLALWWLRTDRPLQPIERTLYAANTVAALVQFSLTRTGTVSDAALLIASTHLLLIANAIVGYLAFRVREGALFSLGSYALAVAICTWGLSTRPDSGLMLTAVRLHVSVATLLLLVYALAWYRSSYLKISVEHELLARQALTDPLTGLPNRHATYAAIEQLLAQFRQGQPGSVILLDVDHFKAVNDTYGHPAGDRVLISLADTLRAHVDAAHTPGRWGGEEFILVLPGVDAAQATGLAERLRTHLHTTPHPDVGTVTASFGVTAPVPGDDLARLTARADQALYRAKSAGRNRVEIHHASEPAPEPLPTLEAPG
ncbi:GGDEF domain-containing protein [uncultured Deinococcus sp.]|uniref:GGDEF domain-containing protein n=1 Tax=uncultured Deinococcus sp. TaxID=158789 RepID=UPI0025D51F47|nr:GGDEF domain-containing protein [uncultured Deinococcus sp.]